MKHLILGSSGQIGTALTKYLKSINEEVIEFDIKRTIDEDLRVESYWLDSAVIESDFVYFLAFDVGGAKYLDENQEKHSFIDNNMRIMTNVFNVLNKHQKPFIFASSPNYPTSPYGMLKRLGEKMTLDINGIITRFWNVYDNEPCDERSHVITDFINMAKKDGLIKMRTDGYESRQFLYGNDCAEALYQISLNHTNLKDRLQNITTFKWYTIKQVANMISDMQLYCPIIPGTKTDSQNDAMILPTKTDILNYWHPKTELKEGIKILYENKTN